ncbi:MAG: DUF2680 domain-containing protein [Syntrophomonadaceae bacterium]
MKGFKKWTAALTVAAVLGAGGAAYAATALTPAEIAANLTGKSVAELQQQRQAGKTYGAIASEAGKSAEFKAQMLEQKKIILDERVAAGKLTQEQANTMYQNMQQHQADCDGTCDGNARLGQNGGAGFGQSAGQGLGKGNGQGLGNGMGNGRGFGNRADNCDGTCQNS